MTNDISIQMKKGLLDLCTLALLAKKERYGYELTEKLAKSTHTVKPAQLADLPSRTQCLAIFGASLAGDMILFPLLCLAGLLLACFAIVGSFLVITAPLLFVPDSMLGQIDVARPSALQLLPTALLFVSGGVIIVGICTAVAERM